MVAGLRGNEPDFYDTEKTESSAEQASSCNSDLLPCPCGKTPKKLNISEGSTFRWRVISGDCCGDWEHECRVPTIGEAATPEGQLKACIEAWNDLPRKAR